MSDQLTAVPLAHIRFDARAWPRQLGDRTSERLAGALTDVALNESQKRSP